MNKKITATPQPFGGWYVSYWNGYTHEGGRGETLDAALQACPGIAEGDALNITIYRFRVTLPKSK